MTRSSAPGWKGSPVINPPTQRCKTAVMLDRHPDNAEPAVRRSAAGYRDGLDAKLLGAGPGPPRHDGDLSMSGLSDWQEHA